MGVSNPPSPLRGVVVADSSDIVLSDIAASYNNFGAPFVLTIPLKGMVEVGFSGRLNNDAGGSSAFAYLGLRIGGVNYWLSSFVFVNSGAGPKTEYESILRVGGSLNDYIEAKGDGTAGASSQGVWRVWSSVEALGLPPGPQNVQLIVARGATAGSLRGATTPSRAHLSIIKG